jgi:heptosyltransferase-2
MAVTASPMPSSRLQPRRLLVRGVNWLGDAVMTTPALQRLREAHPEARLTLLTPAKLAPLWPGHPDVDAVLAFETGEGVWSVARRLREGAFDCALVLPNSPRSALEVWLAGIPRRVGYARPWRNLLLTERVPPRPGAARMRKRAGRQVRARVRQPCPSVAVQAYPASAHHILDYLHLAAALGASPAPVAPRLVVTREEVAAVRQRFAADPGAWSHRPLLGLNPGAEYGPAKRWPRERFIEAARTLHRATGCECWVFGGAAERDLAMAVAREIEHGEGIKPGAARSLAGETSLRELCAAFRACDVVLTNDTGPMHVAAAVGTRVVAIFGSTAPELTGPGLPGDSRHRVLRAPVACAPCVRRTCPIDFRCMTGVSVDEVVAAVRQALAAPGDG